MYFFIDYENVGANGFVGIDLLTEKDHVVLFYSENNCRLPFSLHMQMIKTKAQIEYFDIKTSARNSLDFQLSSYLGYFVATHADEEYAIISNDEGFNPIVLMWRSRKIKIVRYKNLLGVLNGTFGNGGFPRTTVTAQKPVAAEEQGDFEKPADCVVEPAAQDAPEADNPVAEAVKEDAPAYTEIAADEPAEVTPDTAPVEVIFTAEAAPVSLKPVVTAKPAQPQTAKKRKPKPAVKQPEKQPASPSPVSANIVDSANLHSLLSQFPDDVHKIEELISKYKTKQGINNALVKEYGNDKTSAIYKIIKPLLKDKKGK
ncbi:MAG: PIN domain-containing protein [Oscillospiraceae bacterium]